MYVGDNVQFVKNIEEDVNKLPTLVHKTIQEKLINRPGVAGAVLQTPITVDLGPSRANFRIFTF